ncbi:ChaN family lipoprotein [Marinospirillum perlucidum]|uniref:ChaN family lipoprotein n=1 Tax=Marinospirillum perlucidum TaxID=1982602 RepID=UPI001390686C|nr:ChaN family lipoprotein [Marinospirillum perlucidum]
MVFFLSADLLAGGRGQASEGESWLAQERLEQPLVGQLWDVRRGQLMSMQSLLEQLPAGAWLLIGEQHDHPDHQRLAAAWLEMLATQERLGYLALEMLYQDQQPLLDEFSGQASVTAEDLDWPDPGWPWEDYGPLVQLGLGKAEGVLATDLTTAEKRQVYREGASRSALTVEQAQALDELIDEGHCGQLPQEQLPRMRQVQLARDQAMAEVLAGAEASAGVHIFLAGSVHVRADLGVPRWLPESLPRVSVGLQQVGEAEEPQAYLPSQSVEGIPAYDYLFFTPALPAKDYCARFRQD